MGTGKMKFIAVSLPLLFCIAVYAQTEYVDMHNRIYPFLERMENRGILSGYNSFEIPKTRKEAARFIKQIKENEQKLSALDRDILKDLETEFEYELYGSADNSVRIINNNGYDYLGEKQKYLYFSTGEKFNIFINLFAELEYIHNFKKNEFNNNASTGNLGGIIRGNILDKFGFYLYGANGKVFGNTPAALSKISLAQNFKLSERPEDAFFDESEGYLTADFELIKFKLGRDHLRLGYGDIPFVDDYSPRFDYFGIYLNYDFFSYSFMHAKMLDATDYPLYNDKFLVYHRIGFNTGPHFDFGVGEFLVYGRRGIDLSYLNPFVFYKSVEHSNRDRDNSMLFLDINNNSIPGTKLSFSLLMDDISYSKVGTGWWGNQVQWKGSFFSSDIGGLPLDISGNYQRTEPYTFSHRFAWNNFSNFGYSLSPFSLPNSELFSGSINFRFNYRLEFSSGIIYMLHGANPLTGEKIINVGGDISLGHRDTDPEKAVFLDGIREYYRKYYFSLFYEPLNQIQVKIYIAYINNSTSVKQSHKELQSFFTLTTTF